MRAINCKYCAKDLLRKFQIDLGANIVKELKVDKVYLEHAPCKVMHLSNDNTISMRKRKKL